MATQDSTVTPLRSVARPKQARSEKSLQRLLDAADSLIEERGFKDVSIADITRRARSSVGGFYSRFKDKDQLLSALQERFVRQLDASIGSIEESLDPDSELSDVLEPGLALLVKTYRDQRHLMAAFLSRSNENPHLHEAGMAFRSTIIERFSRLILRWRDELNHPDPELAADLSVQLALGFMDQALTVGRLQAVGEPLPPGRLQEELMRAMCAYLGVAAEDR